MKKTVIIILAILPFVLLITIGFAGRWLDETKKPRVTKVEFVEPYFGTPYTDDFTLEIGMGVQKATRIKISFDRDDTKGKGDREVTYKVFNPIDPITREEINVCTIDKDGVITGVNPGSAVIQVIAHDGNKDDYLDVLVKAQVTGIVLPIDTMEMAVGETQNLYPEVNLPNAPQEDKVVKYESSDSEVVEISKDGKNTLTAKKVGTAVITLSVTTTRGQTFKTTCTVTVNESVPPIYFDFDSVDWMKKQGNFYLSSQNEINLNSFILFNEDKAEKENIKFKIQSGSANATLENGVLKFINTNKAVTIQAYANDKNNPTHTYSVNVIIEFDP